MGNSLIVRLYRRAPLIPRETFDLAPSSSRALLLSREYITPPPPLYTYPRLPCASSFSATCTTYILPTYTLAYPRPVPSPLHFRSPPLAGALSLPMSYSQPKNLLKHSELILNINQCCNCNSENKLLLNENHQYLLCR